MKKFKNLKIYQKLMLIFSINFLVFIALIAFYLIPQFKQVMLIEKKQGLKYSVEMVYNLLEEYEHREIKGEFDSEEARKRALERIKTMKYQDGRNYFWVNDLEPKMIMHPTNPKLNGQDLSNYQDPNGVYLFNEMVNVCNESGAGFVFYQWAKKGEDVPKDKVSYVRVFKPWGWIVGTGIWVDELDEQLMAELNNIYIITAVLVILIGIIFFTIAIVFSKSISNELNKIVKVVQQISRGDFSGIN